MLIAGADVLLLDEPTNHLDIEAVEWLEAFLMDFKGALVFVAHDRVFMDRVGTHVLYLGGSNLFSARRRSPSSWNCRKSLRSRGNARPSA